MRDLSKRNQEHSFAPPEQVCFHAAHQFYSIVHMVLNACFSVSLFAPDDQIDEGNNSDNRTAIPESNNVATFSENDNTSLASDR